MTTHIAFLRAVNVGGRRVVKDDLIAAAAAVGATDPWTFLASGNLGLTHPGLELAEALSAAFGAALGFDVPVIVRTAAHVQALAEADPFDGAPGTRFVGFADGDLDPGLVPVLEAAGAGDTFVVDGSDLWWNVPGGYSDSPLAGSKLDRAVGRTITVRKHTTVQRLAKKL